MMPKPKRRLSFEKNEKGLLKLWLYPKFHGLQNQGTWIEFLCILKCII